MSVSLTAYVDGRPGAAEQATPGFGERHAGAVLWLDVAGPDDDDLALLQSELALPPAAVAHVRTGDQRPRVEQYEDCVLIVAGAVELAPDDDAARFHELDLLIGRGYVLTVRQHPALPEESLRDTLSEAGGRTIRTATALARGVLEALVDGYFAVSDEIETRIEAVDERVWDGLTKDDLARAFALRRDLVRIRRVVAPLRESLAVVVRREGGVLDDAVDEHLRDLYEHVVTVHEEIEMSRDLLASTLDAHLSLVSNRMNETVLKVSAWAAIIAVPTVIASIYGMNFIDMPELRWSAGYPAALGLMVAAAAALYAVFKRRGWL